MLLHPIDFGNVVLVYYDLCLLSQVSLNFLLSSNVQLRVNTNVM